MTKNLLYFYFSIFLIISCKDEAKFITTESGLEYKFIIKKDSSEKPQKDFGLLVDMKFYWNDSLLFSSREIALDYRILLKDTIKDGSIYEGLSMMHLGDSVIFKVDAYEFYHITSGIPMPFCIKKGDKLTFHIKLLDIFSTEEIKSEYERNKKLKIKNEQSLLADYLKSNNITTKPLQSGLYYIETKKGTGKKPEIGDSVTLHYDGKLINNEPFDSSIKRNKPFTFLYGDERFVKGWTEGISMMKEGGKSILIIPSELAYGEYGADNLIPPYSTVIFEIHLIKIKKN